MIPKESYYGGGTNEIVTTPDGTVLWWPDRGRMFSAWNNVNVGRALFGEYPLSWTKAGTGDVPQVCVAGYNQLLNFIPADEAEDVSLWDVFGTVSDLGASTLPYGPCREIRMTKGGFNGIRLLAADIPSVKDSNDPHVPATYGISLFAEVTDGGGEVRLVLSIWGTQQQIVIPDDGDVAWLQFSIAPGSTNDPLRVQVNGTSPGGAQRDFKIGGVKIAPVGASLAFQPKDTDFLIPPFSSFPVGFVVMYGDTAAGSSNLQISNPDEILNSAPHHATHWAKVVDGGGTQSMKIRLGGTSSGVLNYLDNGTWQRLGADLTPSNGSGTVEVQSSETNRRFLAWGVTTVTAGSGVDAYDDNDVAIQMDNPDNIAHHALGGRHAYFVNASDKAHLLIRDHGSAVKRIIPPRHIVPVSVVDGGANNVYTVGDPRFYTLGGFIVA